MQPAVTALNEVKGGTRRLHARNKQKTPKLYQTGGMVWYARV